MGTSNNITIRIDNDLRKEAEELFNDFGLTISSAFIMFVKQAVREQRIPFEIKRLVPNETTIAAIKEAEDMEKGNIQCETFNSVEDLMEDLGK